MMVLLCLIPAAAARADSATISVLNTAGQPDPAAGVPRTFQVTGATAAPEQVFVKYRNPGGAPCAPTASSDSGASGYSDPTQLPWADFWGDDVNGSFKVSDVFTWAGSGSYMFCIWIAKDENTSATPITQIITFRSPTGTISATVNPAHPARGKTAAVTITGTSEAPENVYATAHSAAIPCSQNYDADSSLSGTVSVDSGASVNGSFVLNDSVRESGAGNYVLCLWLADASSSVTSIAGPQPIPFSVGAVTPTTTHGASAECKKAKRARDKWMKAVTKTKRQLLHATRRSTRRTLIKRLAAQRRRLRRAVTNVKVIC
jgi:hypothetical protein